MKFFIFFCFFAFTAAADETMAKNKSMGQPKLSPLPQNFEKVQYLTQQIQESGLDKILPVELRPDCDLADHTKVWVELMIGLSYVESKWDRNSHTPHDHNGTPSTGLFQMTGIDVYRIPDKNTKNLKEIRCFKNHDETRNEEKSIHCAVWKMKELMERGASLKQYASNYWGPFKSQQYKQAGKGGALVSMVKSACKSGTLKHTTVRYSNFGINKTKDYWSNIEEYTPFKKSDLQNSSQTISKKKSLK